MGIVGIERLVMEALLFGSRRPLNPNSEIGLRAGGEAIVWPDPVRLLGTLSCRRGRLHHKFVLRASGLHKYPTAFSQWQPSAKSANREELPNTNFGIRAYAT